MPEGKNSGRVEPSDELILAALERAELHGGKEPGVRFATIVEHLGLPYGSGTGRWMRPRFRAVEASGLVEDFKQYGCEVWTLTSAGRERLDAARASGGLGVLPEAPQHRAWRKAQTAAGERIGEFRKQVQGLLDEAVLLLANRDADSEAWSTLGERLQRACRRVSSATYCLREWAEPHDADADLGESRDRWRRNTGSWD